MWSYFNQIEMYVCPARSRTYTYSYIGVGLLEHAYAGRILHGMMVGHQLTRFEIGLNVNRLNG